MKKAIFIWSVLLLFFIKTNAQFLNIADSLKQQLLYAKEDTNKVILLLNLSKNYAWSYADTSIMYIQQAFDLSQKLNYEGGIVWAEHQMCMALITLGNYPLALDYGFKMLARAEKNHSTTLVIFANANIATCYREQGDYKNSLIYIRKVLKLANNVQLTDLDYTNLLGVSASIYEKNNQLDSAILYAKKSYDLQNNWSGLLYVLGSAYTKKNNYDSAMFYYRAGLSAATKNHTEIDLIDIYNGIAMVQKAKGNIDSVAWYATKALAEKVGKTYPLGLLRSTTILVDLYQSQNKSDSTLKYLRASVSLKDSLFSREKTIAIQNLAFKEREKHKEIEVSKLKYKNRFKLYALLGILFTVLSITVVLYRSNRSSKKANELLQKQKEEIGQQKKHVEQTLVELKATQSQLIQSEKMASLGQLTAGIAHEIQNPLNFVNNFSEINKELIEELKEELAVGNRQSAEELANDIKENEEKINHHGKRADSIVKNMLQHSRSNSGHKEPTDINALADEYLRLSYHGMRAKDKSFSAEYKTEFDPNLPKINVIPQDIGRVLLNLINNAFYAVDKRAKLQTPPPPEEGIEEQGEYYKPTVKISTASYNSPSGGRGVEIAVKDNGPGIPLEIKDKIFQPFFTTKPTGQGTGLGLSLAYDIVKAHGGEIKVETKSARAGSDGEGNGCEFIIHLPSN